MTETTLPPALTDSVALLERATGYTLGSLALVTPDALANRTPCRDWDLRALLGHLGDSLLALYEAVAAGCVRIDPAGDDPGSRAGLSGAGLRADPTALLRDRARRMLGAWARGPGTDQIRIADQMLDPGIVAATGAVEVAVHGWDVGRACRQDRPIPPALAGELLALCPLLVLDADRPGRFAPPADPPAGASPSDRLVAFLGRRPR